MSTDFQQALSDTLRHATSGRHRLILVVGEVRSGKTAFLRGIAAAYEMQFLSLGESLGIRLLETAPRIRPLMIEEFVRQLIDGRPSGVCLDNTDILFDPTLRCDPLRLASGISQNTFVLYSLMGRIEGSRFVRGHPDHPEFFSEELPAVPIVSIDRGIPSIYAT